MCIKSSIPAVVISMLDESIIKSSKETELLVIRELMIWFSGNKDIILNIVDSRIKTAKHVNIKIAHDNTAAREIHNSTKDSSESGERGVHKKNRNALFSQENHYIDRNISWRDNEINGWARQVII